MTSQMTFGLKCWKSCMRPRTSHHVSPQNWDHVCKHHQAPLPKIIASHAKVSGRRIVSGLCAHIDSEFWQCWHGSRAHQASPTRTIIQHYPCQSIDIGLYNHIISLLIFTGTMSCSMITTKNKGSFEGQHINNLYPLQEKTSVWLSCLWLIGIVIFQLMHAYVL